MVMDLKVISLIVVYFLFTFHAPADSTTERCVSFPECKPFYRAFKMQTMKMQRNMEGGLINCKEGDIHFCWWRDVMTARNRMTKEEEPNSDCMERILEFYKITPTSESWDLETE